MSDPNTLRILELDGGGERGYMSIVFLKKFIQLWGIDPATIASKFDVICGTSVGGVSALSLAFGLTPDEMLPFFTVQGPSIFSLFPPPLYSVRPNAAYKVALVLSNTPFYQSSGPFVNSYGSGLLYNTIENTFMINSVPATLQDLKTNVIIPSYEQDTKKYVLFSNLNYPDFIGQNELISNVAKATAAPPVYLPAAIFNGHQYIDGGVYQNNPAQFGVTLGKIIKPNANRACVLSLGTGIGELGFDPGGTPPPLPPFEAMFKGDVLKANKFRKAVEFVEAQGVESVFDTIQQIFGLFEIAATGSQESAAKSLFLESSYTLDQLYYYRFQPKLDSTIDTELDNTDPSFLTYMSDTANQVFNNDIDNISTFLGHLTA